MPPIRLKLFPGPAKRALPTVPSNYKASDHANQEIERTVAMANHRYDEALRVNGIPVMLWRRTMEGCRCTCRSDREDIVEDINQNPTSAGEIRNSGVTADSKVIRVQSSRDLSNQTHYQKDTVLGVDIGADDVSRDREDIDISKLPGPEFLDNPEAMQFFLKSGTNTTTCGICLGTGYVGGYSLYGGQRLVFASHNLDSNVDFSIKNNSDEPLTYVGTEGAVLSWQWHVPEFFRQGWLTARANTRPADVEILINGEPVPLRGLSSFKGQHVTVSARALNDDAELTHVEIVLQMIEWPFTQADNIQDDTNYNSVEPVQTLDFPFSPSVQKISRSDVFVDQKYGKVWRVNTVTDYKLTDGTAISWQVSATSRTRFDILSLLKVAWYPSYSLSYEDLQFR